MPEKHTPAEQPGRPFTKILEPDENKGYSPKSTGQISATPPPSAPPGRPPRQPENGGK